MKIVKGLPAQAGKIEIICREYIPNRKIFCRKVLNREKWFRFSFDEQMANVGAEVGRTINWRNRDIQQSGRHFEIGLELLDLTIDDPKNRKRLKELLRVRETLVGYFCFDNIYGSSDEKWNDYFYDFNYVARIGKN